MEIKQVHIEILQALQSLEERKNTPIIKNEHKSSCRACCSVAIKNKDLCPDCQVLKDLGWLK